MATPMTDYETPTERRLRLLQAQSQLEERRQQIIRNRLLCVIGALSGAVTMVLLRRYGGF